MAITEPPPTGSINTLPLTAENAAVSQKAPSSMRQTADAVVAAFNAMDIDSILAHRTPDCVREFLPRSMGYPPQDNGTYDRSLRQLKHVFRNFSLVVDDIVEEAGARKMTLCLRAGADTFVGRYENDYVWMWDFDEDGVKIKKSKEYSDSMMSHDFYPKLKEAMKLQAAQKDGAATQET